MFHLDDHVATSCARELQDGLSYRYTKPPQAVNMMRDIKQLLDPNGILNPYKVLPVDPEFHPASQQATAGQELKSASY